MKKLLFFVCFLPLTNGLYAQVGINTTAPATTLEIVAKSPATHVEGLLIPKLTGDQVYGMPIAQAADEANLVYATSPAAVANQTGVGINLKTKGFFYWDGTVWVSIANNNTIINNILALVKPMNFVYHDHNGFPEGGTAFIVPTATQSRLLNLIFINDGVDELIENNPLNIMMWDNNTSTIRIPQQLLGYAIIINLSVKYEQTNSNSTASRILAFTGDATSNAATGLYTGGGTNIKDVFFKSNPSSGFTYVRDELVLSPIIVTQDMVDHGIKLFLGSSDNQTIEYYDMILRVDYGVVNTTL